MVTKYPSVLLDKAVGEMSKLPGIGRKTALRLVLHLLRQDEAQTDSLAESLLHARHEIKRCSCCHNICDDDVCPICSSQQRDRSLICVVENVQDVMAVEATQQFKGLYHVLGGVISPMDGIGPNDLEIESLVKRVSDGGIKEVILALSPTMEGDTTNFFLFKKLSGFDVKITTIARGVAVGDELQYADEVTLGRSIMNRVDFTDSFRMDR